jgi:hypothetical protein
MSERVTKSDPLLKTDQELLALVQERISLKSMETGVHDFGIVEGAIGALFVGQYYGLRILRILHSSKTLRQYEQFLGAPFEVLIPQHGVFIDRSFAWGIVQGVRHYWDLVARKVRLDGDKRRCIVDTVPEAQ